MIYQPNHDFRSWGGVVREEHRVAAPAWRDDLPSVIASAKIDGAQLLATGLRRSYGDSGLNPAGSVLDMRSVDRLIEFDQQTRRLRAEAGASFDTLLKLLVPRGFFLPVTPGTRFVTLGGAIANDVHGKNHHGAGTLGNWVRRIGLLRSDGTALEMTPASHPDLFSATIGGLGLTGVIAWAEIEVIPISSALMKVENIAFGNLKEFFQLASESDLDFDYTVAWVDCLSQGDKLGRGIFSRARHASRGASNVAIDAPKLSIPFNFPSFALNSFSVKAFNTLYNWNGRRKAGAASSPYTSFFYPLDAIGKWNRMYGRRGMYQYQSVVPPGDAFEATRDMLEAISSAGEGSFLAVLKTFGSKPSPGMLSFPRPGTTLALDFANRGATTLRLLDRLDSIVKAAGGRLYPAKDGRISADMFRTGYPGWETFAAHVDPGFSSRFWQRVAI